MNDGGPAFPTDTYHFTGMSLRDYFAAKAMREVAWTGDRMSASAEYCYQIADAMLAKRMPAEVADADA